MNLSAEQIAIQDAFSQGPESGNLVVDAKAGSGKTFTIVMSLAGAPESRTLYACFNVRNKEEAKNKITDPRVDVSTLNGVGQRFVTRVWRGSRPDDEVEHDRIDTVTLGLSIQDETKAMIHRLVGFLKNLCTNLPTQAEAYRIMKARGCDGLDEEQDELIASSARKVLELSMKPDKQGRISFNDQVWLPVAMNWVKPLYNLVVIDEAQDMNMPQLMMARKASSGRVVVVGDPHQAIYDFRGAASNGIAQMKVLLRAKTLGLSITYRCAKSIVRLANEVVKDYHAAPDAPEGLVTSIWQKCLMESAKPGDAILSRLNAPLMPIALALLRNKIPARIEGRDIGQQLCGMVRSLKARSVPDFFARIESWREKQIARHLKSKNPEKNCERTNDIADTLMAVAEGASSVSDIFSRIESLFTNTDDQTRKNAVVLSSVHKAKGLEWHRVFMLCDTFRKGKGQEEDNIWYVAVTRAMRELYLVGGQVAKTEPAAPPESPVGQEQVHVVIPPIKVIAPKPDGFSLVNGNVFYQVGDVIKQSGIEWVCERVGDCNATFRSISTFEREIEVLNKETFEREKKTIKGKTNLIRSFSNQTEPEFILRRMTKAETQNFLTSGKARSVVQEQLKQTGPNEGQDSMPKQAKAKTERKSQAGLGKMIRDLKAGGSNMTDAYGKVSKKYGFGEPLDGIPVWFKTTWNKPAGKAKAKTTKATMPPALKKKAAKAQAKAKTPPPPPAAPAPKATPPPPAPPQAGSNSGPVTTWHG